MSSIKSIKHVIQGKPILQDIPIVSSVFNSTVEGKALLRIDGFIDSIITPSIYHLQIPSETDSRYIRTSTNLYLTYPDCLEYSNTDYTNGSIEISWRFLPTAIAGAESGECYSIEFDVEDNNNTGTAETANYRLQIIINLISYIG